jgi:hypothetical protein
MPITPWEIKGSEITNCNCAYGCPCQFNALPTHGRCEAVSCYRIDEGRHGSVRLDGLCAVTLYRWPGAVHQGNGTMQLIIDERADAAQRAALERILTGLDTNEMATMWWVFSAMSPDKQPTLYAPIDFAVDIEARRGHILVPGLVETRAEPIRNPITGAEHRVRIDLPNGFGYRLAEIGSARSRTDAAIKLDLQDTYGQFDRVHLSNEGVIG